MADRVLGGFSRVSTGGGRRGIAGEVAQVITVGPDGGRVLAEEGREKAGERSFKSFVHR